MKTVRIGSRASTLAVTQTGHVRDALQKRFPQIRFKVVLIQTSGDRDRSLSVFDHRETGVFTREIEKRLLAGDVDLAVHSLKDLPTELPEGLALGACFRREDPSDCLVTRTGAPLSRLPRGARVGTTSIRRELQLLRARPDLEVKPLRGNLTTRISRVLEGKLDAVVVAKAGIRRIGKHARLARSLPPSQMLPCVGQGILGIEIRAGDAETARIVSAVHHGPSGWEAAAERSLLSTLRGGCRVPIGALARCRGGVLSLRAAVLSRTRPPLMAAASGKPERAAEMGRAVARRLLARGAEKYIDEARSR